MATYFNKVTNKRMRAPAGTVIEPDWVLDPDVSTVEHLVDSKYWKYVEVSNSFIEMSPAEKLVVDNDEALKLLKERRVEAIESNTIRLYEKGFEYLAKKYSLDDPERDLLVATYLVKDSITYPLVWYTKNKRQSISLIDAAAFTTFYLAALSVWRAIHDGGVILIDAIRSANTINQVNNVNDTR